MAARKRTRPKGGAHRARRPNEADGDARESKVSYIDWVWWPNEVGRRSRAEEEFMDLPPAVRGEMASRIKRFLEGESRFKDVDDLGGGIKELRHRVGNNHYRVLFAIEGRVCIGLTCFYKNQQRTERVDLERARKRLQSYNPLSR